MSTARVSSVPAMWQRDRMDRLAALSHDDMAAGLLWLTMVSSQEPESFCAECSAAIGIFLRYGTEWRHCRGDATTIGQIEVFDPGHGPVVA